MVNKEFSEIMVYLYDSLEGRTYWVNEEWDSIIDSRKLAIPTRSYKSLLYDMYDEYMRLGGSHITSIDNYVKWSEEQFWIDYINV